MGVALFDMDRTLVRRETASLYVKSRRDRGLGSWQDTARVAWWVAQYTMGVIDAPDVASRALMVLAGTKESDLEGECEALFRKYILPHISERARVAVAHHKARGDHLAIVTGASPYVARPVADYFGIENVVASDLEVVSGALTGRPVEPLCYGVGKVIRANRLARKVGFALREAVFYTDSYTDLPLLEAVAHPVVVNPDMRLSRIAEARGWPVEIW